MIIEQIELYNFASLNFQNYLLHLIPPELHKLYFFDGEKIADFFLNEQHNNIENFEEHLKQVTEITSRIEQLKHQHKEISDSLLALQDEIAALRKTLSSSRKALEMELKKQSVSALSDRVLLLVEELQDEQYKKILCAVEHDLNEKFKDLIRKDRFVDHIYLDSTFSLHLVRNQAVEVSALRLSVKNHGIAALKNSLKDIGYHALLDHLNTCESDLSSALENCICLSTEMTNAPAF